MTEQFWQAIHQKNKFPHKLEVLETSELGSFSDLQNSELDILLIAFTPFWRNEKLKNGSYLDFENKEVGLTWSEFKNIDRNHSNICHICKYYCDCSCFKYHYIFVIYV